MAVNVGPLLYSADGDPFDRWTQLTVLGPPVVAAHWAPGTYGAVAMGAGRSVEVRSRGADEADAKARALRALDKFGGSWEVEHELREVDPFTGETTVTLQTREAVMSGGQAPDKTGEDQDMDEQPTGKPNPQSPIVLIVHRDAEGRKTTIRRVPGDPDGLVHFEATARGWDSVQTALGQVAEALGRHREALDRYLDGPWWHDDQCVAFDKETGEAIFRQVVCGRARVATGEPETVQPTDEKSGETVATDEMRRVFESARDVVIGDEALAAIHEACVESVAAAYGVTPDEALLEARRELGYGPPPLPEHGLCPRCDTRLVLSTGLGERVCPSCVSAPGDPVEVCLAYRGPDRESEAPTEYERWRPPAWVAALGAAVVGVVQGAYLRETWDAVRDLLSHGWPW